jgi:tetratricopeptide (TPR) repeat protein
MRGIAYSEMKRNSEAISDFTIIIKLDAKDDNAYQWRAYVYELSGDNSRAIDDLTAQIKLSANDAHIYDSRARLLARAGRYKEAIADYGESIELDDNPWTYMYRGQAYEQLGRHHEAVADYSRALESSYFVKHPNTLVPPLGGPGTEKTMGALVYLDRARCYAALGKQDLALADKKKSQALDAAGPEPRGKCPRPRETQLSE